MKKLFFHCIGLLVTIAAVVQFVGNDASTHNVKLNVNGSLKLADCSQIAGKILASDATSLASWQSLPTPPETNIPKVIIGNQTWMIKNLDVITYRNGDAIPKVEDAATWAALTSGAYCNYNNAGPFNNILTGAQSSAVTYGKLYNWYAVKDSRGLAPKGWHIPNEFEWDTLSAHLGGNNVAGGPMKEIGTTHWNVPNSGATNSSGFTGLPGGFRTFDGSFKNIGKHGYWWSYTENNTYNGYAWYRALNYSGDELFRENANKQIGLSVRCVKD